MHPAALRGSATTPPSSSSPAAPTSPSGDVQAARSARIYPPASVWRLALPWVWQQATRQTRSPTFSLRKKTKKKKQQVGHIRSLYLLKCLLDVERGLYTNVHCKKGRYFMKEGTTAEGQFCKSSRLCVTQIEFKLSSDILHYKYFTLKPIKKK